MSETNAPRSITGSTAFAIQNNALQSQLSEAHATIQKLQEENEKLKSQIIGWDKSHETCPAPPRSPV